jgi:hypothetical protein
VLQPAGRIFATVFLLDDGVMELLAQRGGYLSFPHQFDEGCYIDDPPNPTRGVAYRFEAVDRLAREAGLEFAIPPLQGHWSGRAPFMSFGGQDSIVLRRRG